MSVPPSTKISICPEKYCFALALVRAAALPDGFALVAVSGRPRALTNSVAIGWLEMRTPMPPVAFTSGGGISARAGNTKVSGPGQKWAINFSASGEIAATPDPKHGAVGDEHRKGIGGIAAFELKNFFDGGGIERVGAETVKRLGWKNDNLAALKRGDGG